MNLIQLGKVVLSSGAESDFKLVCDQFIDDNAEGLAFLITRLVGPFSSVEGVPHGGLRLAEVLVPFATPLTNYHLLVDDVLTTGRSIERASNSAWRVHQRLAKGAVVFARGPLPQWVQAIWPMPECFWVRG